MCGLQVLDLSYCGLKILRSSISNLIHAPSRLISKRLFFEEFSNQILLNFHEHDNFPSCFITSIDFFKVRWKLAEVEFQSMAKEEELCSTQPIFNPEEDVSVDMLRKFKVNEVTRVEDYSRETLEEHEGLWHALDEFFCERPQPWALRFGKYRVQQLRLLWNQVAAREQGSWVTALNTKEKAQYKRLKRRLWLARALRAHASEYQSRYRHRYSRNEGLEMIRGKRKLDGRDKESNLITYCVSTICGVYGASVR
ncbi:hypothetical protein Syun_017240 [Stephania yunnanensis]|uniref:Uncharacterized protein n=1 Tax=Stephania yunnanensis TaxID=152371 RepID=A0AAP0J6P1_9MAGN